MRSQKKFTALIAVAAMMAATSSASASVNFTTLQLNGGAIATTNDLNLGNGNGWEAMSAFFVNPISSTSNFSGSFDFTLNNSGFYPQADGISFLIQNDLAGKAAVGGLGGDIGAAGIQNAVGIGFQSWTNNHATIFTTASGPYGGTQSTGNFNLGDQNDSVSVSFAYSAAKGILSYTATNSSTAQSISDSYAADLAGLGPSVYIGFTGGSGGSYAHQDVTNFNFAAPELSTWVMMALGFAGLGFAGFRARRSAISIA